MELFKKLLPYKKYLKHMIPALIRNRVKTQLVMHRIEVIASGRESLGEYPFGVNMVGALSGASGLSEASRGVLEGLQLAGIPVETVDFEKNCDATIVKTTHPYLLNIIHANPNQLPELVYRLPEEQWTNHYNIGFWVWEQESIPREWLEFFCLFNEIWTPSEFAAEAIRKDTALPVAVIPHIINVQHDENIGRAYFNLPDDLFLVLIAFDCNSGLERKNPMDAIQAFKEAFPSDERVGLVIKARNLTEKIRNKLSEALKDTNSVFILEKDYSKKEVNSLISLCDAFLSLHRAEGFGLVMAESMYLGTPVVATNWSGNTEFMNESVACMVKAEMAVLTDNYPPFLKGSRWAQPDVADAAYYLRRLYEDMPFREELGHRAQSYIADKLGTDHISQLISQRMKTIQESVTRK